MINTIILLYYSTMLYLVFLFYIIFVLCFCLNMIFVSLNSKMTVVTKGVGIAYRFRAHSFAPICCEVRASQSLFMCSVLSTMFFFTYFFKLLHCRSLDLQLLLYTPLVSFYYRVYSSFSFRNRTISYCYVVYDIVYVKNIFSSLPH